MVYTRTVFSQLYEDPVLSITVLSINDLSNCHEMDDPQYPYEKDLNHLLLFLHDLERFFSHCLCQIEYPTKIRHHKKTRTIEVDPFPIYDHEIWCLKQAKTGLKCSPSIIYMALDYPPVWHLMNLFLTYDYIQKLSYKTDQWTQQIPLQILIKKMLKIH